MNQILMTAQAEIQLLESSTRRLYDGLDAGSLQELMDWIESLDAVQRELYFQIIERVARMRTLIHEIESRIYRIEITEILKPRNEQ